MADGRKAALTLLEKCRRAGAWSDAALGSVLDAEGLEGSERAFAAAICYGVLQNRLLLDHMISQCATMPPKKMEPKVLDILRITAYQLMFMDKVPAAAAVDSAVKHCKALGYARASGFVNAVSRRLAEGAYTIPEGNDPASISLRYSHPAWLAARLSALLGADETAGFCRIDNAPAPITIQTNTLRTNTVTLLKGLQFHGLEAELHPWVPDCILLQSGSVCAIPEFQEGHFYVQDAAAKLSVLAAAPQNGQRILDVCAAPGGKSFAAAILSGGGVEITACDLHQKKLARIQQGAQRLGLECITTRAMDARQPFPEFVEGFDLVIADVPCSGLGVIRKKPDIRYKAPENLAALPEIQAAVLRNVSAYVRPGGTLLYSTCTVLPEENSEVVTAFLKDNPAFVPENYTLPDGSASENGMLQLWPQRHGTDGFFVAKMRKWK